MTIIIYRALLLRIHLLTWYVVPKWKFGKVFWREWLVIKFVYTQYDHEGEGETNYCRSYKDRLYIYWLCFTIQFAVRHKTKLADIYPANYKRDEDPAWREKYDRLVETGYEL